MDAPILVWAVRAASTLLVSALVGSFFLNLPQNARAVESWFQSRKGRYTAKRPQDAPNGLPILGHALSFSNDMSGFTMKLKKRFNGVPLRLRLIVMDIVYLTDPDQISSLFRRSTELTNGPYRKFVSSTFGVPKYFQKFFAADNSGLSRTPLPGSNVKPENRVDYLMHSFIVQFMTGKSLKFLASRFTENMEKRLSNVPSGQGESLYDFVKENMFHSSVRAMFGTHIFDLDPDFCEHFWAFEHAMPELAMGLPRIFYRKEYAARDVCIKAVHSWQESLDVQRRANPEAAADLGQEEYDDTFGSGIVKKRHAAFAKMEVMGADARASEDLALIWGANSNATHAAFWLIYSILRDPATEARFLTEIRQAEIPNEAGDNFVRYDIDALCAIPYLQSLYTETLRLYVANIVLRSPRHKDMAVGDYTVRKGEIIATMSYPMHMDSTRFNIGTQEDPRLLADFWPERFLVPDLPEDPWNETRGRDAARDRFSLKGTDGAWIPYGGGANMCPGRYFAKQEMLLTAALLLGNFELQLGCDRTEIDWRYFGSGVLGVGGRQQFSMRRRR